ncbi:LysM peptidoglycan-binding domain-containing protein [Sanguibacter hominis]|uniref:LysM peptidoglycan-binding domain-containing protein n=1 Tax=Sanguibacter hominis TaxID=1312739 RepID=UPI0033078BFB
MLALLTVLSLATAVTLGAACLPLAQDATQRIDAAVGAGVLAAGTCAAAWTTAWLALTLTCVVAARAGRRRDTLERTALRIAPAVARRFVAAALGATIAVGALPAHASEPVPVADVGWQVSSTAPTGPADTSREAHLPSATPDAAGPRTTGTQRAEVTVPSPAPQRSSTPSAPRSRASTSSPSTSRASVTAAQDATSPHERARSEGSQARKDAPVAGQRKPSTRATTSPGRETVTVRSGDTLWALAARSLGSAATNARIAHEWPRWHDANRDLIGDDPHLIRPGEILTVPTHQPTKTTPTTTDAARG